MGPPSCWLCRLAMLTLAALGFLLPFDYRSDDSHPAGEPGRIRYCLADPIVDCDVVLVRERLAASPLPARRDQPSREEQSPGEDGKGQRHVKNVRLGHLHLPSGFQLEPNQPNHYSTKKAFCQVYFSSCFELSPIQNRQNFSNPSPILGSYDTIDTIVRILSPRKERIKNRFLLMVFEEGFGGFPKFRMSALLPHPIPPLHSPKIHGR